MPTSGRPRYLAWWLLGALCGLSEASPVLARIYELLVPNALQADEPHNPAAFQDGYDTTVDWVSNRKLAAR
ncbi:hypothetical protein SZ64_08020 [Erythrobacter sp. SG61-1L]|nr:hypothetical protein SZ64_08020 [Erythrobacter sp. SG61-1L]